MDLSLVREAASSSEMPFGARASDQYEILKEYIEEFQSSLDSEHEVGMKLTSFGESVLLNVTSVDYENPVLIIFKGFKNGSEATLIQHVSQLNFMLVSVKKEPNKPKRIIGFRANDYEEE